LKGVKIGKGRVLGSFDKKERKGQHSSYEIRKLQEALPPLSLVVQEKGHMNLNSTFDLLNFNRILVDAFDEFWAVGAPAKDESPDQISEDASWMQSDIGGFSKFMSQPLNLKSHLSTVELATTISSLRKRRSNKNTDAPSQKKPKKTSN